MKNTKQLSLCTIAKKIVFINFFFCGGAVSAHSSFDQFATPQQIQSDLTEKKYPVDIRNNDGLTGLMVAAKEGNIEKARVFLSAGAKVNARSNDADANTALHFAVYFGENESEFPIIEDLIDYGADVNSRNNNGDVPIHFTMKIQNQDLRMAVTDKLVLHGADINARNREGNTMLHIAADQNDISWIKKIKNPFGSLLNYDIKNNAGLSPKQLAQDHGLGDMAEVLNTQVPLVLGDVTSRNEQGRSGLMLGILRGDLPFCREQIKKGAHVNAQDNDGRTPLFFAVITRSNQLDFIDMLIPAGAKASIVNNKGQTPLFSVTEISSPDTRIEAARRLIKNGADVLAIDKQGRNILEHAIRKNDLPLVKFLVDYANEQTIQRALTTANTLNRHDIAIILESKK